MKSLVTLAKNHRIRKYHQRYYMKEAFIQPFLSLEDSEMKTSTASLEQNAYIKFFETTRYPSTFIYRDILTGSQVTGSAMVFPKQHSTARRLLTSKVIGG